MLVLRWEFPIKTILKSNVFLAKLYDKWKLYFCMYDGFKIKKKCFDSNKRERKFNHNILNNQNWRVKCRIWCGHRKWRSVSFMPWWTTSRSVRTRTSTWFSSTKSLIVCVRKNYQRTSYGNIWALSTICKLWYC